MVKKCTYGIWLKIYKSTLNTEKDVFVVGIYLPPSDSQYAFKAPFEQMEKDFSNFLDLRRSKCSYWKSQRLFNVFNRGPKSGSRFLR